MGVDPSTLQLRIVSTDFALSPDRSYEHLSYEVFHEGTGAVVASNKLAEPLEDATQVQNVDSRLVNRAIIEFNRAKWQYGNRASLNDYSPFDISLILEGWSFQKNGDNWDISHPLSGSYSDIEITTLNVFPEILPRAMAIMDRVLPPPTWAWASSPSAETLAMNCVAVPGATSYVVYQDHGNGEFTLLGSPPTEAGGSVSVAAGYYIVRMGGVVGGVIGALSLPVNVLVDPVEG